MLTRLDVAGDIIVRDACVVNLNDAGMGQNLEQFRLLFRHVLLGRVRDGRYLENHVTSRRHGHRRRTPMSSSTAAFHRRRCHGVGSLFRREVMRRRRAIRIVRIRRIAAAAEIIIIDDDPDGCPGPDQVHEGEPALAQLFDDVEAASADGDLPPDEMRTESEAVVDVFHAWLLPCTVRISSRCCCSAIQYFFFTLALAIFLAGVVGRAAPPLPRKKHLWGGKKVRV